MNRRLSRVRQHTPFILLITAYVVASVWLTFRLPAFSTPNEQLHYEYVALLIRDGELPDPSQSQRADERHQPPLYYSLVALLGLALPSPPLDNELQINTNYLTTVEGNRNLFVHAGPTEVPVLYLGRLVSLALGAAAVTALYWMAALSFSRATALLVASLMAFQPMFLFLSASLSNDLALTAMVTFLLAYTALLIERRLDARAYVPWGLLFAMAMLTKSSAIFLVLLLPLALLAKWWHARQLREVLSSAMLAFVGFAPVYLFWPLYNYARDLDPLALSKSFPLATLLTLRPGDLRLIWPHTFTLWRSFWLDWSAGGDGYLFDGLYIGAAAGLLLALAGWLRRPSSLSQRRWQFLLHLIWAIPLVALFIGVKLLMIKGSGVVVPEGRWLLPLLPSLAWLAGGGAACWWEGARWKRVPAYATFIGAGLSAALLVLTIPRFHPQARQVAHIEDIPVTATPVGLVYGDRLALVAFETEEFVAGRPATVTLYWQALENIERDYQVRGRLVVPGQGEWEVIDTRHTYHGNGLSPSKGWRQGEIYEDQLSFYLGDDLDGPSQGLLLIDVGEGVELLPVYHEQKPVDLPLVATVALRSAEPLAVDAGSRLASPIRFGDSFELIGLSLDETRQQAEVTLWWQAIAETNTDYTVFLHLVDDKGRLVDQSDGMPNEGRSPTHLWQAGDVIKDVHTLPASPNAGDSLRIGMYDVRTMERLPAVKGSTLLPDSVFHFQIEQ